MLHLLPTLIFFACTAHAQVVDQSRSLLASPNDPDIPHKTCKDFTKNECRYWSLEGFEELIKNTDQYKAAIKLGLNVIIHFDYFVANNEGNGFVRHQFPKELARVSYTIDTWHFYVMGTFTAYGMQLTAVDFTNMRLPPSDEDRQNETLRLKKIEGERLERERIENERKEQERIENERKEQERIENERKEQERLEKERLENIRLEKERVAEEKRLQIEGEKILEQKRIEVNKTLVFQLPKEQTVGFIIDSSGSINEDSPVTGYKYIQLAKQHLITTLQLLKPTQKFVIAFSGGEERDVFNNGELILATEDNVQSAIAWIDAYQPDFTGANGYESFDLATALIARHQMPKHMIFFTDGAITPQRYVTKETLKLLQASHTVTDIAPIPNKSYLDLIKYGFSVEQALLAYRKQIKKKDPKWKPDAEYLKDEANAKKYNNYGFIREITSGTGGRVLSPVKTLPDPDAVTIYKAWLEKVEKTKASKAKTPVKQS